MFSKLYSLGISNSIKIDDKRINDTLASALLSQPILVTTNYGLYTAERETLETKGPQKAPGGSTQHLCRKCLVLRVFFKRPSVTSSLLSLGWTPRRYSIEEMV